MNSQCQFGAAAVVSNRSASGIPIDEIIRRDLATQVARVIAGGNHVKKEVGEFQTTYRLEVYIMTADELHREAQRIASQMMGYGRPYDMHTESP